MIEIKEYLDDVNKTIDIVKDFSMLKNKKIMILGATGTIGSFIVDVLMERNKKYHDNITIYVGSKDEESIVKRFNNYLNDDFFIPFPKDLTEKFDLNFIPDYIIQAASDSFPSSFANYPVEVMLSNMVGTNNLLEYCKGKKTRLLFISSGEVYGQYDGNTPIKEEYQGYVNNLQFRSCYPISKRAAETLCISYQKEYDTDVVIARLSHVYGPFYRDADNKVHIKFLTEAINGRDIIFKKINEQTRSYIYIADVVSGILLVLLKGISGEVYNIANDKSVVTIEDMAKIIATKSHVNIVYNEPTLEELQMSNPMSYAVLDNSKLRNLGWTNIYNFESGIERLITIRKKM